MICVENIKLESIISYAVHKRRNEVCLAPSPLFGWRCICETTKVSGIFFETMKSGELMSVYFGNAVEGEWVSLRSHEHSKLHMREYYSVFAKVITRAYERHQQTRTSRRAIFCRWRCHRHRWETRKLIFASALSTTSACISYSACAFACW